MINTKEIRNCIERFLDRGFKEFIIYPYGEVGMKVKVILNECYGIKESFLIDENLSKYNNNIQSPEILSKIDSSRYIIILATINEEINSHIRKKVRKYFHDDNIGELNYKEKLYVKDVKTKVGKYSYGPLCNHVLVESVGAFCSFAIGCNVVDNHSIGYLSTHPFIYADKNNNPLFKEWERYSKFPWFFEGIEPKGKTYKLNKIKIGNDVWIGKNALITNGSNIGNGCIIGAGSIVTKDVPDYAIVVGVPGRILRYRFTAEQINDLNEIQWWNWSDEQIRFRYNDFFLPIEKFIEKYKQEEKIE